MKQVRKKYATKARGVVGREDRKGKHLVIRAEKLGRSLGVDLPDDPMVAKALAIALGSSEILRRVAEYRANNPPHLSVLDDSSLKSFLRNARRAHREAHPASRKRGRRSEESVAMMRLLFLRDELGRDPTRTEMIQRLMDENLKGEILSKNTAGKYAKLYRLWSQLKKGFSKAEKLWLCKNFGKESLSLEWWMDRWWRWLEEILRGKGVLEDISNIFSMPLHRLSQMRDELEMRRIQILSAVTNERQQLTRQ